MDLAESTDSELHVVHVGLLPHFLESYPGTLGYSDYPIVEPIANSEVNNDDTYRILKLTLHPKSYDWRFVPARGGSFTDSRRSRCHG